MGLSVGAPRDLDRRADVLGDRVAVLGGVGVEVRRGGDAGQRFFSEPAHRNPKHARQWTKRVEGRVLAQPPLDVPDVTRVEARERVDFPLRKTWDAGAQGADATPKRVGV